MRLDRHGSNTRARKYAAGALVMARGTRVTPLVAAINGRFAAVFKNCHVLAVAGFVDHCHSIPRLISRG